MELKVRYFGGCKAADITIPKGKICLISGKNASSKSSLALAAGLALANEKMPLGKPATEAMDLVYLGSDEAILTATEGDDVTSMTWAGKSVDASFAGQKIGTSAAGLLRFTELNPEKRSLALISKLNALPTDEETAEAIKEITGWKDGDGSLIKLMQTIKTLSWDKAAKEEEDRQLMMKAQWCAVTAKRAWANDGEHWKPDGWDIDCKGASADYFTKQITDLDAEYSTALKSEAVNEAEIAKLKEQEASVPALEKAEAEAREKAKSAESAVTVAKANLKAVPAPGKNEETHACWSCGVGNVIRAGGLHKPNAAPVTPEEIQAQIKAHDEAVNVVEKAQQESIKADAEHRDALGAWKAAKNATMKLADMVKPVGQYRQSALIKAEMEVARTRQRAVTEKVKADKLYRDACTQIKLVDMLKPDGLRQEKLTSALTKFNVEVLGALCTIAKWDAVVVDTTMGIKYGPIDFEFVSESQQHRVNTIFQLAFAILQGDQMVIIDRADVLDKQGRVELFSLLSNMSRSRGIGSMVCMTANLPADVPNLAANGAGVTYWMEEGVAKPLGQPVAV